MLHAIYLALLHFWLWANTNSFDPYDPTNPLMSPVQISELVVFGTLGALILVYAFHHFGAWQERRWEREFRFQRRLEQACDISSNPTK